MSDALAEILIIRGAERLAIVLIGGMSFILAWHAACKSFQQRGRQGSGSPLAESASAILHYLPSITFVVIGCWLLASVMHPFSATISEAQPKVISAAQPANPLSAPPSGIHAFHYEDCGLSLRQCEHFYQP
jgi:hypothetical protein